ncbi:MAG: hypothetical protein LBP24_01660 [Coriobacteriales bacterium]|jgi:hypothetical protein|nr:hypothetical protein [Coriobacteriales bacterium]
MKKVLLLAGVLVAVVAFALFYQFRPIGMLDFNAYVLQDNTIPQNLNSGEASEEALEVESSIFDIFSPLYELAGDLFIGEERAKPNPALPIFANDGSALMLVNNSARLVDSDFQRLTTFRGQFVSNGAAYNPDRSRSDPNIIMLVALSNGLYANAMELSIEGAAEGNTNIAMNSIMRFSKTELAYYEMAGSSFYYQKLTGLDEESIIQLGPYEMTYYDFLRRLGLLRDMPPRPEEPEELEEEDEEPLRPVVAEVMPAVVDYPYEAPQVSLSSMRPYVADGFARGRLHVSDISTSISSDITIYINGVAEEYANSFTLARAEFTGRQTLTVNVDFSGLTLGADYAVFGEYWYRDSNGEEHYVRFGDQTFRYESSDHPAVVDNYVKPVVTFEPPVDPLSATTYHFNGMMQVKDPAARIVSGVRFEITRLDPDGDPLTHNPQLYARKYALGSGPVRLGPLPPDEPYRVRAYFIYRDAYNVEQTEELFVQELRTKSLAELAPIRISFKNGQLYSNRISLGEVAFDPAVAPYTLEAVSRVTLEATAVAPGTGGTSMRMAGSVTSAMKKGEAQVIQTADTLAPDTSFDYVFVVQDSFGNTLPLLPPTGGTTHTCKALPSAALKATINGVGHTGISVAVTDIHHALTTPAGNLTFQVHDMDGNLVSWYPYPYERGVSQTQDFAALPDTGGFVEVAGLKLGTTYRASVVADYDIADGLGVQYAQIIGSTVFTTPKVESLGNLVLDSRILDDYPTHEAIKISSIVNGQLTNQELRELLDSVTFTIYRADDALKTVEQSVTFQCADPLYPDIDHEMFDKLVAGDLLDPALLEYLDLPSMTEYVLETTAQIRVIDQYYDVGTSNTVTGFKTLRKPALGVIPQYNLMGFTDRIYIFDTYVDDPNGAVVNRLVTMKVTEVGTIQSDGSITGGTNMVVALETLKARTADEYEPGRDFVISNLETGHRYKIEYTASEYNNAYDYTTYRTNVRLDTFGDFRSDEEKADFCYYVDTKDSLAARLSLVGMDAMANDSAHLLTSLKSEITDRPPSLLGANPAYTLRFYKRPGYGDYELDTANFAGGVLTVDLGSPAQPPDYLYSDVQRRPLSYYCEYRVELVVYIAGNEIVLDQVEFDTDGPMILIGVNYGKQYAEAHAEWADLGTGDYRRVMYDRLMAYTPADDLRLLEFNLSASNYKEYSLMGETPNPTGDLNALGAPNHGTGVTGSGLPVWAPTDGEKRLGGNMARYLVVEDLLYDVNFNTNDSNSGRAFNGLLDFQGHSLTYNHNTSTGADPKRRFMNHLGPMGTIRNVVYNTDIAGNNPDNEAGMLYGVQGRVSNIQVNVKGWNDCYNYQTGIICTYLSRGGVIEGFAVNLLDDVWMRGNFGTVAFENYGTIRNGYVYSSNHSQVKVGVVPGSAAEAFTAQYIGGILGVNRSTGKVVNVFSLVDVNVTVNNDGASGRSADPNSVGAIVGYNDNGQVQSSYTASALIGMAQRGGSVYFDNSRNTARGPGVGGQGGSSRTLVYFNSTSAYTNSYNSAVGIEVLRDYLWQGKVLGSGFLTEKSVTGGFYPQLDWPYCMPAQPYLSLPGMTSAATTTLSSVMVEKQFEDEAIVLATFKNPNFYPIRALTITGLTAEPVDGTQTDVFVEGITYKRFRVHTPTVFKSSYSVVGFAYRPLNTGTADIGVNTTATLNAQFFKPVRTPEDWVAIKNDLNSNYRLKNNIDLRQLGANEIRIGTDAAANAFRGHLDAGYYNDSYELQGFYTIELPALNNMPNGTAGVIPLLYGRVTNMGVSGLQISAANDPYVGFVRFAHNGALMDNLHFTNASLEGRQFVGAAIAQLRFADIMNCSVNDVAVQDMTADFIGGGLVGSIEDGSTMYNCYASGVNMTLTKSTTGQGAGALVGRLTSGEIQNVYAEGRISSLKNPNVGGIVGAMSGALPLQHFWADVTISSDVAAVGAVIGSAGATGTGSHVPFYGVAIGDVSSTSSYLNTDKFRPVRRFNGWRGGLDEGGTNSRYVSAFFWDQQKVNGKDYDPVAAVTDATLPKDDGADALTTEQLSSRQVWMMQIRMGDEFEYEPVPSLGMSGVANAYLPLLNSTHGGLLPNQTPVALALPEYSIDVQTAEMYGSTYTVRILVKHPAGDRDKLRGITATYLGVKPDMQGSSFESHFAIAESQAHTDTESLMQLTFNPEGELERYRDSYRIENLVLADDVRVPVEGQIVFAANQVPYRTISNIATWRNVMKPEAEGGHGDTMENFSIGGDIDFAGLSANDLNYDLQLNRLVGAPNSGDAEGLYTLKNLNLTFNEAGHSFIKLVTASFTDLRLKDIKITQTPGGGQYLGVVGTMQGDVRKLRIDGLTINGNSASRVGTIGYLQGNVTDVVMQRVFVKSNQELVGGLVGLAGDSNFSNIKIILPTGTAASNWPGMNDTSDGDLTGRDTGTNNLGVAFTRNPSFVQGTNFTGGIVGRGMRSYFWDCSAEFTTVCTTAGASYLGVICGHNDFVNYGENVPVSYNLKVRDSVAYGNNYVGGLFGHTSHIVAKSHSETDATLVARVTVVARDRYAGGAVGHVDGFLKHVEVRASRVFGAYDVGGIAGWTGWATYMDFARDVIVSTIYDPSYSATGLQNIVATPQAGKNIFIGGIAGRCSRVIRSGVVNCVVGGKGATEVGGILGRQEQYGSFGNSSLDTRVFGANQIGGIAGRYSYENLEQNVSNATVEGTGQYVGGIVGYLFSSQPLFGTRAGSVRGNMFAGTVTGQTNVGGIVGYVQGELYPFISGETRGYNNYNARNHMLGNVTATGGSGARADFIINLDPAYTEIQPYYSRILGAATLTVGGQTHTADWLATNNPARYPYKKAMYYDGPTDTGGRTVPANFFDAMSTQLNATQAATLQNTGIQDPNNPAYRVPIILGEQGLKIDTQAGSMTYGTNRELAQTTLYNSAHYQLSYDRADGKSAWWDGRLRYIYRSGGSASNGYFGLGGEIWYGSTGILATPGSAQTPGSAGFLPYAATYNGLQGSRVQSYYSEGSTTGTPEVPDLSGTRAYHDTSNIVYYTGGMKIPVMSSSFTPFGLGFDAEISGEANLDAYAVGADKLNLEFPEVTPNTEFVVLRGSADDALAAAAALATGDAGDAGDSVGDSVAAGAADSDAGDGEAGDGAEAGAGEPGDADDSEGAAEGDGSTGEAEDGLIAGFPADAVLFNSALENRTYSFNYDFTTPLTVLVNQDGVITSFGVDPQGLRRSVMVYGDALYHVTASGVQSSVSGLLPGTYLHLQNGEALAEGGVVFDLATGSIARHVGDFTLAKGSPLPLFETSAEGVALKAFKNYTQVGDGGVQPMRMVASDGTLFPVDPALPVVHDALLAGVKSGGAAAAANSGSGDSGGSSGSSGSSADFGSEPESASSDSDAVGSTYLTVLDDEGMLVDTQAALVYPKNFSASGIAEMTNNLATNRSLVMVRYANGKVLAFDYLSGETVELVDAAGDESFADYANRFFAKEPVSKLAGLSTGYLNLTLFKAAVENGKLPEGHIGPNLGSEVSPDSGAPANNLPVIDGDPVVPGDGATGGGSAVGAAAAEGGSTGADDPVGSTGTGGSAVAPLNDGAAGESVSPAGSDGPGSSGDFGATGDFTGSGSSSAATGNSDLARPTPGLKTVAMFNYGTGFYELFDREGLLTGSNSGPVAIMDDENLLAAGQILADSNAQAIASGAAGSPFAAAFASGIPQLVLIFVAIAVLLAFLFIRRVRLSKK